MTSTFETLAGHFTKMHMSTDGSWVSEAAQKHGCGIQHHTPFERPNSGDYNLHTVAGYGGDIKQGTLNNLKKVQRVIYTCMERRTSSNVASTLKFSPDNDAFFATAGGPAQEFSEQRFNVDVEFFAALMRYADQVPQLVLVAHSGVCGGVAKMTDYQSLKYQGKAEIQFMTNATRTFADWVSNVSGLNLKIRQGVAVVENDKYQKIAWH